MRAVKSSGGSVRAAFIAETMAVASSLAKAERIRRTLRVINDGSLDIAGSLVSP